MIDPLVYLAVIDLTPLYPRWLADSLPDSVTGIRRWYVDSYKDPFFAPAAVDAGTTGKGTGTGMEVGFIATFLFLEACMHVPMSAWALGGIWRGNVLSSMTMFWQGDFGDLFSSLSLSLSLSLCVCVWERGEVVLGERG
jgi:hypothetical protein